jgi:hypothetical protein
MPRQRQKQKARLIQPTKKIRDWSDLDKDIKVENQKLKDWMEENYGIRCKTFVKNCILCKKWKLFDELKLSKWN